MAEERAKVRNLAYLLESGEESDARDRLRFVRSLVPNALVLVGPEGFVCGLCGSAHRQRAQAHSCLVSCLELRKDEGVVTVSALGSSFVCPTCSKRYARREDAIDCHGRQRRLSKLYLGDVPRVGIRNWDDSGFSGLKERENSGRGRLFQHELRLEAALPLPRHHEFSGAVPKQARGPRLLNQGTETAIPADEIMNAVLNEERPSGTPPQTRPQVQSYSAPKASAKLNPGKGSALGKSWDSAMTPSAPQHRQGTQSDDRVSVQTPISPEPLEKSFELEESRDFGGDSNPAAEEEVVSRPSGPTIISADGPFREPGMKAFTRADARYKCTVCHSLFFTKDDVEACFEAHPLRPE